ncbi:replication factor A protein 3 [Mycena pura]|uniref:Replication factor A protein 3 n=1 Tax=Mycena pura TaxID=153505 RepID=A0AAD6VT32_9AGAR|nr:replication factor A protein 3 [Mycena pura]
MAENAVSMRVNSELLPRFVGKIVRLTCRPVEMKTDAWTVQACDGGTVTVTLQPDSLTTDAYYEVIGGVTSDTTIKMYRSKNLGNELDMTLVNDTINLMHDPRFYSGIFEE